jgi:hypothetical protein
MNLMGHTTFSFLLPLPNLSSCNKTFVASVLSKLILIYDLQMIYSLMQKRILVGSVTALKVNQIKCLSLAASRASCPETGEYWHQGNVYSSRETQNFTSKAS